MHKQQYIVNYQNVKEFDWIHIPWQLQPKIRVASLKAYLSCYAQLHDYLHFSTVLNSHTLQMCDQAFQGPP